MTGGQAGDPLDFGQVFFFDDANRTTPLNTFADRDKTIINPNPFILSQVGTAPPFYMLDQPYFIQIRDKFNNLVATLENYLPGEEEPPPSSETGVENLFPNYGFETKINENIFSLTTVARK